MTRPPWPAVPRLDWNAHNVDHLAQHGVHAWEVDEMIMLGDYYARPHKKRRKGDKYRSRYLLTGKTLGGRALLVVVDFSPPDRLRPVTAL